MEEAQPRADVWPDNALAVDVFERCISQWRVGFGGPYALDYNVFPIVAAKEFNTPEWPEILDAIQVMEQSALKTMMAYRTKK